MVAVYVPCFLITQSKIPGYLILFIQGKPKVFRRMLMCVTGILREMVRKGA